MLIPGSLHRPEDSPASWFGKLPLMLPEMNIIRPDFPPPPEQTLSKWGRILKIYQPLIREGILVAHSLGNRPALSFMENNQVGGAVLVAPPFKAEYKLWNELLSGKITGRVEDYIGSFFGQTFDWPAILENSGGRIKLLFLWMIN